MTTHHHLLFQAAIQRTGGQRRGKSRERQERECLISEERGALQESPALCEQ